MALQSSSLETRWDSSVTLICVSSTTSTFIFIRFPPNPRSAHKRLTALPATMPDQFEQRRQERDDDDAEYDQRKIALHPRDVAEQIAGDAEATDPQQATERARQHEQTV